MADMTLKVMLDDTSLAIEAPKVTASVFAIAGYVNGSFANWAALVAKWGKSGKYLLSIDIRGVPSAGAQCLDIENGDATIASAPAWFKATQAAGKANKDLRFYPKLYTSESNLVALVAEMTKAGIARNEYMLWSAHYGQGEHICGPKTCGSAVQADATQWTDSADGVSLDQTSAFGYFFAGPSDPVPLATPVLGEAATSPTSVTLHWAGVSGAASFDVQLLEAGTQAGRANVHGLATAFTVKPATKYTWRVASLPGGSWSVESAFETPAEPKPVAPVPAPVVPAPSPANGPAFFTQEILTAPQGDIPAGSIVFIPKVA